MKRPGSTATAGDARTKMAKWTGSKRAAAIDSVQLRNSGETPSNAKQTTLSRQSAGIWRPWLDDVTVHNKNTISQQPRMEDPASVDGRCSVIDSGHVFAGMKHPVKLIWPGKCYDYMYRDAMALLKNLPVQATIIHCESSDDDETDEE